MKGEDKEDKDDFLQKELWNLYYLHSYHKSLDWQTEKCNCMVLAHGVSNGLICLQIFKTFGEKF